MSSIKKLHKHQTGDTIVEVLISLMVIGLAIGIGYGIASRSLKAARQSQERTEAVKIAEGQIERMKGALSGTNTADKERILGLGSYSSKPVFCMNATSNAVGFPGTYGGNIQALSTDDFSSYPTADCVQGLYKIIIDEESDDRYAVVVRWDSLGSNQREEVKIKYKVYE
jgi:Tfp pilus assembly protein PilV